MMKAIRRVSTSIAIAVTTAFLLIGTIVELGRLAQESIASDKRYFVSVSEIECTPPPDQDRIAFLNQVHYYGQLPECLHLLDAGLRSRLTQAFLQHPRVHEVTSISISGSRQIRVDLVYRD